LYLGLNICVVKNILSMV